MADDRELKLDKILSRLIGFVYWSAGDKFGPRARHTLEAHTRETIIIICVQEMAKRMEPMMTKGECFTRQMIGSFFRLSDPRVKNWPEAVADLDKTPLIGIVHTARRIIESTFLETEIHPGKNKSSWERWHVGHMTWR
jgi:hypothetical protein